MKDLIGYYFSLSIFVTTRKYVSNGIKTNERRGMLVEKCWPEWPENVHWPDGPLSIHFKWPAGQCLWESLCMTYVVHPVIAVLHIIFNNDRNSQSSKWKFGFTNPNQILEFILIYSRTSLARNLKGLSKSVRAIGSSSHRGPVILERKKSGSDPGQFHYAMITNAQ
jgi:hypothetical protein